ncbi:MAG: hypothetical protein JWL98_1253 [Xanthomonadaceae bacterium]|nr:hypothetical protein [Xanthomonadaceae bacterium]
MSAVLLFGHAFSLAHAQNTPSPGAAAPTTRPAEMTPCCVATAGTVVDLETTEPISSRDRKHGDLFGLRLHTSLIRGGLVVIPAGTTGVGEIVHADRARGGGKPGELILAARYLQIGDQHLRLHALRLGATGKDNAGTALAVSMAIGVFAQFIHGGEVEVPTGTLAQARLLDDFTPADVRGTPTVSNATGSAAPAVLANDPLPLQASPSPTTVSHPE